MIYLALGVGLFAMLVWVGRRPAFGRKEVRVARALMAAFAAVASVAAALRGIWTASLVLVALSTWLGAGARRAVPKAPTDFGMSEAQARAILGVEPDATRGDIQAAYLRLIRRVHPDVGGAVGLAVQLNAARDRLTRA